MQLLTFSFSQLALIFSFILQTVNNVLPMLDRAFSCFVCLEAWLSKGGFKKKV